MKCYNLKIGYLYALYINLTREGMLVPIYLYVLYMIHLTCIGHIQEISGNVQEMSLTLGT